MIMNYSFQDASSKILVKNKSYFLELFCLQKKFLAYK